VLGRFVPELSQLTIVRDPDHIVDDEVLLSALRDRGYDVLFFEEPLAFRLLFERDHRQRWSAGEAAELIVVDRSIGTGAEALPYDIVRGAGSEVHLGLAELFPDLAVSVVKELTADDRERLFYLIQQTPPTVSRPLGDTRTRDYVLAVLHDARPASWQQGWQWIAFLVRLHTMERSISGSLRARLLEQVTSHGLPDAQQIELFLDSPVAFFAFMAAEWSHFLDRTFGSPDTAVGATAHLDFKGHELRTPLMTLFASGRLAPMAHPSADAAIRAGFGFGVVYDAALSRRAQTRQLLDALESELPAASDRHGKWLHFAWRYAELRALRDEGDGVDEQEAGRMGRLQAAVDERFTHWLRDRFGALSDLPPRPPVMVHHVARRMAARRQEHGGRCALIVIDGLALAQWTVLRDTVARSAERTNAGTFHEGAVFAWIPTLTSVSRQAAFAGERPFVLGDSLGGTDREERFWRRFWENEGLEAHEVDYRRGLRDWSDDDVERWLSPPRLRAIGLVIDRVDRIVHGAELGTPGAHRLMELWAKRGALARLVRSLLDRGFEVHLTSDHGNVEAEGIGAPRDGAAAEARGERVRIFRDQNLRARVAATIPESIEWAPIGLPQDYFPLIAPRRTAFVTRGEQIVAHGGVSLEEVIVPWIEITAVSGASR
jgi:hypothetical protein